EAHFPALQARSRAPPRLLRAQGDRGRPQGARRPPRPRPQSPLRL
ncbi:MAG: LSU ribosomal protein L34p, partial [uncultured Sphingomonadaceae bacterium]